VVRWDERIPAAAVKLDRCHWQEGQPKNFKPLISDVVLQGKSWKFRNKLGIVVAGPPEISNIDHPKLNFIILCDIPQCDVLQNFRTSARFL
jgi:hypothetical protein